MALTRHIISLLLLLLHFACLSCGWQAQDSATSSSPSLSDALNAFTRILLAGNPAAALHTPCRPRERAPQRLGGAKGFSFSLKSHPTTSRSVSLDEQRRHRQHIPAMSMISTRDFTSEIMSTDDTESILDMTQKVEIIKSPDAHNVVTAFCQLATINEFQRASRDKMKLDSRYELIVDTLTDRAPSLTAGNVARVLWSAATLRGLPPKMLNPVLRAMATQLELKLFEARDLASMTWALARLQLKPVKLLEQVEDQAVKFVDVLTLDNCHSLLWGFAQLQMLPSKLLPKVITKMKKDGMINKASPLEVVNLAFALQAFGESVLDEELALALAERATSSLSKYSSKQILKLMYSFAVLKLLPRLPEGTFDGWESMVRKLHAQQPMKAGDQVTLQSLLNATGRDASWVKRSAMLSTWSDIALGRFTQEEILQFTDDEMMIVFKAIDTDGSGTVDLDELAVAIKSVNPDMKDDDVKKMVELGDVDKDGEISFEEFSLVMLEMPKKEQAKKPKGDGQGDRKSKKAKKKKRKERKTKVKGPAMRKSGKSEAKKAEATATKETTAKKETTATKDTTSTKEATATK